MSRFDPDKYINYQKLTENLKIVRDRYILKYLKLCIYIILALVVCLFKHAFCYSTHFQVAATFDLGREDHLQSP